MSVCAGPFGLNLAGKRGMITIGTNSHPIIDLHIINLVSCLSDRVDHGANN